ncbi:hypothetical protein [Lacipirellula parvula]|uniref:hypothetical protein n=1 Tax=Lacipirellula parvula TaxID=2650471 RepID=UPI001E3C0DD3|nr:hypothetical protein [Lacipirellula parvula]
MYRLKGRNALVLGAVGELTQQAEAALAAAGATVSRSTLEGYQAVGSTPAEFPNIVVLVTVASDSPASNGDWEAVDRQQRTLVALPTAILSNVVPAMRRAGWGRIIFVADGDPSSMAAITARTAQAALLQAEARQLAAAGITVNQIIARSGGVTSESELAEAIGAAALYFASEESSFVTGQSLQIGG